jgi:hypothetical protein
MNKKVSYADQYSCRTETIKNADIPPYVCILSLEVICEGDVVFLCELLKFVLIGIKEFLVCKFLIHKGICELSGNDCY